MSKLSREKRRFRGVTLVELMVVIAIAGVLASIAIPSYRSFIISNRISSISSDLHSSLLLARSEALKRGMPVAVCATKNPNDANPSCDDTSDVGWGSGWIVYVEVDGTSGRVASEELIQVKNRSVADLSQGIVSSDAPDGVLLFNRTGQTFTKTQFVLAAPSGSSSEDRSICVAVGGRARVEKASTCA